MATSLTLRSIKGAQLTIAEVDANFTALRTTSDGAVTAAAAAQTTANSASTAAAAAQTTATNAATAAATAQTTANNVGTKRILFTEYSSNTVGTYVNAFTAPAGCYNVTIYASGGGQESSAINSGWPDYTTVPIPGASGKFGRKGFACLPGDTFTIVIGAGGLGGSGWGSGGRNGSSTTVTNNRSGEVITAPGGGSTGVFSFTGNDIPGIYFVSGNDLTGGAGGAVHGTLQATNPGQAGIVSIHAAYLG